MPLSDPAPREALHFRAIDCRGYRREDGLWDIEAHMTDTKSYTFTNRHRGEIKPGEPLHDMWLRLTIDDEMTIRRVEAATEAAPFHLCGAITDNFRKLEGLAIRPGWKRAIREKVGGVNGCTHLVELLQPLATVAFQTVWSRRKRERSESAGATKPGFIDSCHALRSDGEIVRDHFPDWYSGNGKQGG